MDTKKRNERNLADIMRNIAISDNTYSLMKGLMGYVTAQKEKIGIR
jgi:hypothetical protein